MQLQGIKTQDSSWALTLLSLCECVTYVIAAFLGDYLKVLNIKNILLLKLTHTATITEIASCVTVLLIYLQGKLVYVNIGAAGALSLICITWPFVDVSYSVILTISLGESNRQHEESICCEVCHNGCKLLPNAIWWVLYKLVVHERRRY